jgi:uncharacterized protein (DUF433 family)
MDWQGRITLNPKVLADKPVVRGTWLSVESVIGLLMAGRTVAQVLQAHDELTLEDVQACLACAREALSAAA